MKCILKGPMKRSQCWLKTGDKPSSEPVKNLCYIFENYMGYCWLSNRLLYSIHCDAFPYGKRARWNTITLKVGYALQRYQLKIYFWTHWYLLTHSPASRPKHNWFRDILALVRYRWHSLKQCCCIVNFNVTNWHQQYCTTMNKISQYDMKCIKRKVGSAIGYSISIRH